MANHILSKEDLNSILQEHFKNPTIKYITALIQPISQDAEGFMGDHYKLEIIFSLNGTEKCEKYFLKTKSQPNSSQDNKADMIAAYKREIFHYDFLFKEFAKYGYNTSFTAKSYYCIPNKSLIMEDLTLNGYRLSERHQMFNVDKIKCVLYSLAQFHAAGFAYDRSKSKELGREFKLGKEYPEMFNEMFYFSNEGTEDMVYGWWHSSFQAFYKLIDVLPYDEQQKQEFKDLLMQCKVGSSLLLDTKLAKTCCHGDLWSNNIMFFYDGDTAVNCCLVDYQIGRYFYPALDVVTAIYFTTNQEFRKHYLNELYQYYYDTLLLYLHKYDYDIENILPLSDFHKSIEIVQKDAMLQVASNNLIVCLPKKTLTELKQSNDSMEEALFFKKADLCLEAYRNNPQFSKVITESMHDLRNSLLIAQQ